MIIQLISNTHLALNSSNPLFPRNIFNIRKSIPKKITKEISIDSVIPAWSTCCHPALLLSEKFVEANRVHS